VTGQNTLTAAVLDRRISSMVPTEVITSSVPVPLLQRIQQHPLYLTTEARMTRMGLKMSHAGIGAAIVGALMIFSIGSMVTGPGESAAADSVRLAGNGTTTGVAAPITPLSATGNVTLPPGTGATTAVRALDTISTALGAKAPAPAATKAAETKTAAAPPRPRPVRDVRSNCPALGTRALTTMQSAPAVLMDTIVDKKQGDTLRVAYDICGLRSGAAFTTSVEVRKIRQSRFRRATGTAQQPIQRNYPDAAIGPRHRKTRDIILDVSGGTYLATVIITDERGRKFDVKREFQVDDK
jgi:hypothetical protein